MIRALVKIAMTYALAKALKRAGGPAGVLGAVLDPGRGRGARRRPSRDARRGR